VADAGSSAGPGGDRLFIPTLTAKTCRVRRLLGAVTVLERTGSVSRPGQALRHGPLAEPVNSS